MLNDRVPTANERFCQESFEPLFVGTDFGIFVELPMFENLDCQNRGLTTVAGEILHVLSEQETGIRRKVCSQIHPFIPS